MISRHAATIATKPAKLKALRRRAVA